MPREASGEAEACREEGWHQAALAAGAVAAASAAGMGHWPPVGGLGRLQAPAASLLLEAAAPGRPAPQSHDDHA